MKYFIYIALVLSLVSTIWAEYPNAASTPGTDYLVKFKGNLPDAVIYTYYRGEDRDVGLGYSYYQGTAALGVRFPREVATTKGWHCEYPWLILSPEIVATGWGSPDPNEFGMLSLGCEARFRSQWEGGYFEWRVYLHGDLRRNIKTFETDPENPYNPSPSLGHGGGGRMGFILRPGQFYLGVQGGGRLYSHSTLTSKRVVEARAEGRFYVADPFWFGGGCELEAVPKVSSNEEVGYQKWTPFVSAGLDFDPLKVKARALAPTKGNYESLGFDVNVEVPIW